MARGCGLSRLRVAALLVLLPAAGCSLFSSSGPKPAKLTAIKDPVPVQQLWKASLPAAKPDVLMPAVANGSVFAAGGTALARYDLASGKEMWRIKVGQIVTGGVGSDGKVVVIGTGKANVLAYSAEDGKLLWTVQVSSEVLSPPAVADGLVVVRTGDNQTYALEADDGKRRWHLQRASPALVARSRAEAVIAGSSVYEGFAGGKLVSLNAKTGALQWEATVSVPRGATELERISDITSPPVVMDNIVCAVAFQGRLSCFETGNGNPTWSRDVSSTVGMALDARYVFVPDEKGVLYAFDHASGASLWKNDKLGLRQLSAPVSQGRFVIVGDLEGYLHFINRDDGAIIGRFKTDGSPIVAEMKIADQVLVVQTEKGALYAVKAQ
jgi:outer membrane protein assembly factor BamB